MTSLAFILGVLPLAISTGAGSASRHSIGTGVIGGMLAATFVAILFVPLFFRLLTRRKKGVATSPGLAQPHPERRDYAHSHARLPSRRMATRTLPEAYPSRRAAARRSSG